VFYAICADLLTAFHAAYVGFVVLGELAILIGAAFGARWARNPWFRGIHLLCIGVVVMEAFFHIACPLTVWEYTLRDWAGQATTRETFVGRLVHLVFLDDQFAPWVYEYLHIGFGILVLATYILLPPRWRKARPATGQAPVAAGGTVPSHNIPGRDRQHAVGRCFIR
jgi:hypothetical protein